jgi:hypothetical protein
LKRGSKGLKSGKDIESRVWRTIILPAPLRPSRREDPRDPDALQLGVRLSYREAARVMGVLLPTSKAINHTGVRRGLALTADRLQALDNASPHETVQNLGVEQPAGQGEVRPW